MRYDVDVNGTRRHVTVERRDGSLVVVVGERMWRAEAAQAGSGTLSLLMEAIIEHARLKAEHYVLRVRLAWSAASAAPALSKRMRLWLPAIPSPVNSPC